MPGSVTGPRAGCRGQREESDTVLTFREFRIEKAYISKATIVIQGKKDRGRIHRALALKEFRASQRPTGHNNRNTWQAVVMTKGRLPLCTLAAQERMA